MSKYMFIFLMRSKQVVPGRLQSICDRLARMLQAYFSGMVSGRIHVLPVRRSLDWLGYSANTVTADIVTVASFGTKWVTAKVPMIPDPTIVVECDLMPGDSEKSFEKASLIAEVLKRKLRSILANYGLKIDESRMMRVPMDAPQQSLSKSYDKMDDYQVIQEMRRIKAAEAVLKRRGLDVFDRLRTEDDMTRYQPILGLWQNESFLADLEQAVLAELEPDPGGVRRFLADFEARVEDLDARWLLALSRQESGKSVATFPSLLKEYQKIYSEDLLQKLMIMQENVTDNSITQRRLDLWQQVAERELVDVELEPHRTALRQIYATHSFHMNGKQYKANEIISKVLREEPNRKIRLTAWKNLAQLSRHVAPTLRKFLVRSNSLWQDRGYENAISPRLKAIGVSKATIRQIITSCEQTSRQAAQELIQEYEDLLGHEIASWDWRFAAGKIVHPFEHVFENVDTINCIKQTFQKLGIVIDQLPIQIMEALPIQYTICYHIRIPHDILVSYGSLSGFQRPLFLLYALGKACSFSHIDESLAYPFRRNTPLVLTEGIGTLISWSLLQPDWLKEFTSLTGDQIEEFIRLVKGYELLKMRLYAGLAAFELDAYEILGENPNADLNKCYNQCMKKFLLLPKDNHTVWAAEPRVVEPFPEFIKRILGMAVAANLMDYFQKQGLSLFSPSFGELFRSDLIRLGASNSWLERLQHLTSRALTPFPMSWSTE